MNDWDNVIPEERAAAMFSAHIDKKLRDAGHYSHVVSYVNADGNPRTIRCHARHVDETVARLKAYGDRVRDLAVQVL
jgi:hypothetical protein